MSDAQVTYELVMARPGPPDPFAGIGMIVPFDFVLDDELWAYAPPEVRIHMTRTPAEEGPIDATLVAAVSDLAAVRQATASVAGAGPAVTVYACTSGSYLLGLDGERSLRQAMERAGAQEAVTTSGALLEALDALSVTRLAVATPHQRELAEGLVRFLEEAGITVTSVAYLDLAADIHAVGMTTVIELAECADAPDAEALFLSCTNLPTLDLIPRLEERLGKPVLAANQVSMWAALRRVGLPAAAVGQRLFETA